MTVRNALIRVFQILAIGEAVTWAGLLIGMLFKYVLTGQTLGARFFGAVHGFVMLGYVMSVFLVRPEVRWSNRTTLVALAASVPPFATVPFERWAVKRARALDDEPPRAPVPARSDT